MTTTTGKFPCKFALVRAERGTSRNATRLHELFFREGLGQRYATGRSLAVTPELRGLLYLPQERFRLIACVAPPTDVASERGVEMEAGAVEPVQCGSGRNARGAL